MRRIGLLGGMSWESTAEYYRLANRLVAERLGGYHSADLVLRSVDFAVVEDQQSRDAWDESGALLAEAAQELVASGAECIALCTNTMHLVADEISAAVDVPFVHLIDVVADAAHRQGLERVALLGTGFTMGRPFYREHLERRGLSVVLPSADERELVHRVIYDELVHGVVREESREAYRKVIEGTIEQGARGVILGCTEIELLVRPEDCPVPVLPTTRLHVEALVDWALQGSS
jgi:aspartate racemase